MNEIMDLLVQFRDGRDWKKYHTNEALARSLMIEAAELNRLFQWGKTPGSGELADEIADCLIYGLNLCIVNGFDPVEIMRGKIGKNAVKYPVESIE